MSQEAENRIVWDTALAADMVGKTLLVGVTYYGADGSPTGQEQFYGNVKRANTSDGIVMRLDGTRLGEEFALPPDTRSVYRAAPGQYRLRSTGEVVVDPDFTVTFNVNRHAG